MGFWGTLFFLKNRVFTQRSVRYFHPNLRMGQIVGVVFSSSHSSNGDMDEDEDEDENGDDDDDDDHDDDPKSTSCLCSISYDVDSLIQVVTFSQQGGVEPGFTRFPAGSVPQGF